MVSSKIIMLGFAALMMTESCAENTEVLSTGAPWPDAECRRLGEDFQVDPRRSINAALTTFHNQVLPRAAESGRSFPAYYDWLVGVTNAVSRHQLTDGGEASDRAQSELASFIPSIPVGMPDLYKLAALREQTRFREMATNITRRMRCQTDDLRSAAVEHLWTAYRLPH